MVFDESNIMTVEEVEGLFSSPEEQETSDEITPAESDTKETTEEEATPLDLDNPFGVDSTPESVGSEENNNQENTQTDKGTSSPLYSSLAKTLAEEGILYDSDDNKISDVKDAASLLEAMKKSVQAQLTEQQKRVADALNNGVETNVIRSYENTLQQLDTISDAQVSAETEAAENLRKNIIYRDFINKGFSDERAKREV